MADYLPDTNLLLRIGDANSPLYTVINDAINTLRARGDVFISCRKISTSFMWLPRAPSARGADLA